MTNQTLFLLNWQKGFFDVTLLLCARPSWQNVSLCWKMMLKFWSICVWCVCTVYSSPTTLKFFSRTKSNMSREIYVSFYVFNGRYLHVTSHHIYCLLPISGPVPEPFLTCNTTFLQKKRPEIRTHILKSNKLVHPPKLMKKVFKKPDINQDNIVAVDVRKRNMTFKSPE